MPEAEAEAGFGQHARGACLAQDPGKCGSTAVESHGQVGYREFDAEQARCPQGLTGRSGQEAEAGVDRARQRWRHRAGRERGHPVAGDGHP
ncbi:MAG TPA: hypothetical protein VHF26_05250, partial [Trebonia sp.]|nr:hypothetical protein [Trebonia sp.]